MPGVVIAKAKRNHTEIIAELLDIASGLGATKTALVYRANLNFTLANRYIEFMEGKGMIERAGARSPTLYRTTDKGAEALSSLRNALDAVSELPA